jgi:post-segregation antitoxin (ccd killing protein)
MRREHQTDNTELPLASARVQTQLSNKHNLVLYVDQELVEKSRELGLNLSKTFENHLKQLLTQFSQVSARNDFNSKDKNSNWWAGPDLNRRPLARKANVLTKLDDRPPFH